MRKIYGVTGYKGYVGSYILSHYDNFVGLDCDVTNPTDVENCIGDSGVNAVLHLAAKSDVEWCEKPENEKTLINVNLRGTFNVCLAAEKERIGVLLLSSDHVFGGNRGSYRETDKPSPRNQYGLSKLSAEGLQEVFDNLKIVRTSYLFDFNRLAPYGSGEYPTFIYRTFMYLPHFVESLVRYLDNMETMPRLLHISGTVLASWYQFMSDWLGLGVMPRTKDIGGVPRPMRGGLDVSMSKRLGFPQYSYQDGLVQMEKDYR